MNCELTINVTIPKRSKKRNRVQWAIRKMQKGEFVARHCWKNDATEPQFMFIKDGSLYAQLIGTQDPILCAAMSWRDVCAKDWFIVDQLELCR